MHPYLLLGLWGLALPTLVQSQLPPIVGPGDRPEGSFNWTQPLDTVILGQYGHSEPVYPSPRTSGIGGWEEALIRAQAFVDELTLEEKAWMVTGAPGPCTGNIYAIPRLNFTGLCLMDGPASLRTADYVSVFPAGITIAASWDRQMIYERSLAMGREFRAKGAHIALTPAVGPQGRSVYSGRNWEGFSPDAYLSGVAFAEAIHGLQDAGVQATAKHFLLNEQETVRTPLFFPGGNGSGITGNGTIQFEAISSNVDDRTIHENYMWPYYDAVRAGVSAVMCALQRVNGSYACQNSKLLNGYLKTELGFQGYVMSDWWAAASGVGAIEAGLDMDLPGSHPSVTVNEEGDNYRSYFGGNITLAVNNGTLDESRLDDMILRIMTPYYNLHQDDEFPSIDPAVVPLNTFFPQEGWFRDWDLSGEASRDVRDNHGDLIRQHAAASTVLLKNTNNALPLRAPRSIAVFGNDAGDVSEGPLNQVNFEYGTLAVGGGSGAARFTYLISPLEAIKARARQDGALVQPWLNNTLIATTDVSTLWSAQPPDVCLVFTKTWSAEFADRYWLDLDWRGNDVVNSVASSCNNTVVVMHTGGVTNVPFSDHPNVTAILVAHYPGQESGNSIADVLYGDVNPAGRLPYTIALNDTDYNGNITTAIQTNGTDDWQSWFIEGLETDYKYFDAQDMEVRFPFGYGLSYTTFSMFDLLISRVDPNATIFSRPEQLDIVPGGNPALWETLYTAQVTVRNTGTVRGATVAQLYISLPDSAPEGTPVRQLRGFDKVELGPGARSRATFELMRRDLSYWDVASQEWVIPTGEFTVSVGFDSRNLTEVATITVVDG